MDDCAVLTRPQTGVQRYFAVCIMEDWEEVVLVARAGSEVEACNRLHDGYRIMMVMELLTPEEQLERRLELRKGLMGAGLCY